MAVTSQRRVGLRSPLNPAILPAESWQRSARNRITTRFGGIVIAVDGNVSQPGIIAQTFFGLQQQLIGDTNGLPIITQTLFPLRQHGTLAMEAFGAASMHFTGRLSIDPRGYVSAQGPITQRLGQFSMLGLGVAAGAIGVGSVTLFGIRQRADAWTNVTGTVTQNFLGIQQQPGYAAFGGMLTGTVVPRADNTIFQRLFGIAQRADGYTDVFSSAAQTLFGIRTEVDGYTNVTGSIPMHLRGFGTSSQAFIAGSLEEKFIGSIDSMHLGLGGLRFIGDLEIVNDGAIRQTLFPLTQSAVGWGSAVGHASTTLFRLTESGNLGEVVLGTIGPQHLGQFTQSGKFAMEAFGTIGPQHLGQFTQAAVSNIVITGHIGQTLFGMRQSLAGTAISPDEDMTPQGRLTLTTAVPFLSSDVTAAATIYYALAVGNKVPLYDGASTFNATAFTELSQALSDATKSPAAAVDNANYDMFVWSDSGTVRCTRGPFWSKTSTVTMTIAGPGVVSWTAHGLAPGTPVSFTTSGTLPTGIVSGTVYYSGGTSATVTISNANPAVVTLAAHGLSSGMPVSFSTTGALPAGITAGTVYYVAAGSLATGTFNISATPGGANIVTTNAGSGTHTVYMPLAPSANSFSVSAAPFGNWITTSGSQSGTHTAVAGNDTGRGTGSGTTELQMVNGIQTNKNAITNGPAANLGTYVGTIRTNAAGTVDQQFTPASALGGSGNHMFVWNMYNRRLTTTRNVDNKTTWGQTGVADTWRAKDVSIGNRVTVVIGMAEDAVNIQNTMKGSADGANGIGIGIGLDTMTSCLDGAEWFSGVGTSAWSSLTSEASCPNLLGLHYFQAIEIEVSAGVTVTWDGSGTASGSHIWSNQALSVSLPM